ncbi:hydroxyisourate hydrolase [Micromonospora sp. KC606]|uniref:hydroxyisourate hydrolase n=1 Tax=Micromonospora sp. KC606 TaxID=2530379 RepID=UPI00104D7CF0|nr:hydroxyisourate hydrolase [Micromonospora sp. KC606]TDC85033.1 hydroxyisourate hydrolase [Micromonospora sp. KC606]
MSLSTHVLDASRGQPASEVQVVVERRLGDAWQHVTQACTDTDGRVSNLRISGSGTHRLRFDTGQYFAERNVPTFYPEVVVTFEIDDDAVHHHVPLLLSPFGYSTYRGS